MSSGNLVVSPGEIGEVCQSFWGFLFKVMTLTESFIKSLVTVGFTPKQAQILNGGNDSATNNVAFLDADNTFTGENIFASPLKIEDVTISDASNFATIDSPVGFNLKRNGTTQLKSNGATTVDCAGIFRPASDNTYDLGTSGSTWKSLYIASIIANTSISTPALTGITLGSWEPDSYAASGSMTWTSITRRNAYYMRIGSIVFLQGYFIGTIGGTASNILYINGLPIAPHYASSSDRYGGGANAISGGSSYAGVAFIDPANDQIGIVKYDRSNFASTGGALLNLFYRAAS